jgi:hypothetical protein
VKISAQICHMKSLRRMPRASEQNPFYYTESPFEA